MVMFSFSILNLVKKNQKCLSKLKFGTKAQYAELKYAEFNGDVHVFSFDWKYSLVQKIKFLRLS